jgi:hypothetical protein
MTLATDKLSRQQLLRDLEIANTTYRAAVARHHGDELAALHELLSTIVDDTARSWSARKLAALRLVQLERDRYERLRWQRAAHRIELRELAARGVVEAAVVSANQDCMGCAAVNNALLDPGSERSLERLPPRICLHLEQGHSCCIGFAPRVVAAQVAA